MNLELLKKLVKLALHNPNENEANAAAVKVCKIIEAGEFRFVEDLKIEDKTNSSAWTKKSPKQSAYDDIQDFIRRSTRQQRNPYWSPQWDGFKYSPKEPPKPSQMNVKCAKCGKKYTLKEGLYVEEELRCNECQWTEYNSQRNKEKISSYDQYYDPITNIRHCTLCNQDIPVHVTFRKCDY